MKTVILLLTLFLTEITAQNNMETLLNYYENKDFFRFNRNSENGSLNDWQVKYINALKLNLQSKNEGSNSIIADLLANHSAQLADSLKMQLLEVRMKNSVNLYDYNDALFCTNEIVNNYSSLLDSSELFETKNSGVIWQAAEKLKKQSIELSGNSNIPFSRDLAGLINIPVMCNGHTEDFIFDTGANFSVVSSSYAKKLKMIMIGGGVEVGSVTGKKISSKLAYAELIEIGNMKLRNVLFLVMPDESLSFAGGLYVINGIIGLPVIKAMNELHIRKNEIFIPQNTTPSALNNLLIDGFVTIIEVVNKNDSLAFTFDTGAKTTMLFSSFYHLNKSVIDKKYEPEEIEFSGAGGTLKVKGFVLNDLIFKIGNSRVKLDDIKLVPERIKDHDKSYFGNLGQDYMSEFSEMILNFKDMYVDFKK